MFFAVDVLCCAGRWICLCVQPWLQSTKWVPYMQCNTMRSYSESNNGANPTTDTSSHDSTDEVTYRQSHKPPIECADRTTDDSTVGPPINAADTSAVTATNGSTDAATKPASNVATLRSAHYTANTGSDGTCVR
mmetsp:Transcript_25672/g.67357  ORF Transcript_25672/g.67357 Transcript_25672/m.67357 type:complete len:134 (-) Transcript_25672:620-1021(-)